ncbi:MAG: hypothetical protein QOD25_1476, partial [Alphaproteobacteria bacterium]|nr:hypothetical protein [Alphaproteobacteria bacterium]
MIGSGIPISHSNAPLPNVMVILRLQIGGVTKQQGKSSSHQRLNSQSARLSSRGQQRLITMLGPGA